MPPKPWVPASVADVVAAGLQSQFPGRTPLRLAGFSFGGHVAGLVSVRLSERVGELTLIGVAGLGLPADPREPFWKERTGMSAAEIAAVYRQNLAVLMLADPGNIDTLAIYLQWENVKRARFRSRPFAPTDELALALAHVTASVRTIWGTEDAIARSSSPSVSTSSAGSSELRERLIEAAGHWVMYEAADAFNAAFLGLLEGG